MSFRPRLDPLLAVLVVFVLAAPAAARRPPAARVLPRDTLLYVRITDVPEMAEKLQETSMGRMARDPQIMPLLEHLYGSAREAMSEAEEEVGLTLPEILTVPQGEMAIAMVARAGQLPAGVLLLDIGEDRAAFDTLLERGRRALEEDGAQREEATVGDVTLTIHTPRDDDAPPLIEFEKDRTLVVTTDRDVAAALLAAWNGGEVETLAENPRYAAVMNRCRGSRAEPPQLLFFADPIAIAHNVTVGNTGAKVALALLPTLGLDGLQAIGGSVTMASEKWDMLTHAHVLLEEPRDGVLAAVALKPGEVRPEAWVPDDVAEYTTLNWDLLQTYEQVEKIVDSLQANGTFAAQVERRISEPLELDFEQDLLAAAEGRVTIAVRYQEPATLNSRSPLFGIKLKDAEAFAVTLDKVVGRFPERLELATLGSEKYYRVVGRERPEAEGDDAAAEGEGEEAETPQQRRRRRFGGGRRPCLGIVGDYLLMSDREESLHAAMTAATREDGGLADSLDFKLVASRVGRQTGGTPPAMFSFQRPEEGMRYVYELATRPENREWLRERSEENAAARAVAEALDANEMPPFEVLARYLAPGGAIITSDVTGLHYMAFGLKREIEETEPAE